MAVKHITDCNQSHDIVRGYPGKNQPYEINEYCKPDCTVSCRRRKDMSP